MTTISNPVISSPFVEPERPFNVIDGQVSGEIEPRSGRTLVMGMLIAWQALNKLANPYDRRFLDTDDGEAFSVRHACVTGDDDPYDKLRGAHRADISDEAWAHRQLDGVTALPATAIRQDCDQGHQPLRR